MNRFYDVHIEVPPEELADSVKIAKKLGWSGFGLAVPEEDIGRFRKEAQKHREFDIALGFKIEATKSADVSKTAKRLREKVELIMVQGGEPEINRAALETPEVDILLSPWSESGCGLNHVLARMGKKNNVAICFGFRGLVYSYRKTRARTVSGITEAARIVKRFKCPFVFSGDSASPWELRSPSELTSFGRLLGFRDPEIKAAMSGNIVEENRKRLRGKWVMPGVEIV